MKKLALSIVLVILACQGFPEPDPRTAALDRRPGLDKPITLSMRAATLREVLDKVEAATKVRLRPDREIAEDKATIQVKDKSARDVLRALAHCFNLCWTESDSGYLRLCTDRNYKSEMDRRAYEDYRAILDQFDQQLGPTAALIRSGQQYKPTEAELEAAASDDERVRLWQRSWATEGPQWAAAVLQYMELSDMQRKSLFEGKDVVAQGASISAEAGQKCPDVTSIRLWIEPSMGGYLLWYHLLPMNTAHMFTMAVFDDTRYNPIVKAAADKLLADPAFAGDLPIAQPQEQASSSSAVQEASPEPVGTIVVDAPALPGVARPGEGSAATPATMSDNLLSVAQATGIPIVAQYLSEYAGVSVNPEQETMQYKTTSARKIGQRLAELCNQHRFTMEHDGKFLLAKPVLWHRFRSRELPEKTIMRWQRVITGLPVPTFDIAIEMGSVPKDQLRGIINGSRYWFGIGNPVQLASCERAIKLYSSLAPAHKHMLAQGAEIPMSVLKPEQRHIFMKQFEYREQPTYERAQDPLWANNAWFSVEDQGFVESTLFAVAEMRSLGVRRIEIPPPPEPLTEEGMARVEQEMRAGMAELLAAEAGKFAASIAEQNPAISRRSIAVYAVKGLTFKLRLGDAKKQATLRHAVRIYP
jgi:hypothetical protein